MDIDTRIRRRRRRGSNRTIVLEYDPLSPVAHVEEPTGRGPLLERILDHFDPVFDGSLPPDAYLWGPRGSGKTGILTALFDRLGAITIQPHSVIHTTTRAQTIEIPRFVYIDARDSGSEFQLYHAILDGVIADDVPQQGVSTDELKSRLRSTLEGSAGAVVAIDHVAEPDSLAPEQVLAWLDAVDRRISTVLVGRSSPSDTMNDWEGTEIEIPGYGQQVLIDILMTRGSSALARDAFRHDQARRIASWAGGNAHDALAVLFGAADAADVAGSEHIREQDIDGAIEAVPEPCASLGVVLAQPENRQRVLRELLELDGEARSSVTATTEAIAAASGVDLSAGTVKRFLYELADAGIVERVTTERPEGQGRPPSSVEPRFPTRVFRRLYDLANRQ